MFCDEFREIDRLMFEAHERDAVVDVLDDRVFIHLDHSNHPPVVEVSCPSEALAFFESHV